MEDCREVTAWCPTPVAVTYKLKSWCNRWLTCSSDDTEPVKFGDVEADASDVTLVPCDEDGKYKLQLCGSSFAGPKSWFLCTHGRHIYRAARHPECSNVRDVLFTLELLEHGGVRIRGGGNHGYLSSDRSGCFWTGAIKPRRCETFTFVEKPLEGVPRRFPWIVRAPVRVTLQTGSGKYLCAAKPVVCACAEAPCCCEEFLLDLSFTTIPLSCDKSCTKNTSSFHRGFTSLISLLGYHEELQTHSEQASSCTIRTANGTTMLSAQSDGSVFTTNVGRAEGREAFFMELHPDRTHPKVSIQQATAERRYFSSEYGYLVNKRFSKKEADYFNIQLANGSEVLVKSVHGGFLGVRRRNTSYSDAETASICSWQLRSHGDSLYTLISTSACGRRGDRYLFVDSSGHLHQSSDPSVHFPATASLFEIKPVSEASVSSSCSGSNQIAGFTIRTVLRINGKQRFLSVEPNGSVTVARLRPSRWELFQLIDVDAAAAAFAPEDFACTPAAFNLQPPAAFGPIYPRTLARNSAKKCSKKACEVAAMALQDGVAVPRRSSTTLQELCIASVCCHASEMRAMPQKLLCLPPESELADFVALLCSVTGTNELLPISVPAVLSENALSISDDLISRVWAAHRLRQVPRNSCKWMPSAFIPPPPPQAQGPYGRNNVHRFGGRVHHRGGPSEGWHCSSCDQSNVLPMDAALNPAHHRYLEVQSRVYSRALQSTGILWNLISLAGVSIMSTALFCQLKAAASRRGSLRVC